MNQKLFVFKNYAISNYLMLSAQDGVDIAENYSKAVKDAEKDGLIFTSENVPEQYLEKYKLKKVDLNITESDRCKYGHTCMDRAGIFYASCEDCDGFIDGVCRRYGGLCDPDDKQDCIYGDDIYRLTYTPDNFSIFLSLSNGFIQEEDTSYAIAKILEIMDENEIKNEDIRRIVKKDGYNASLWELNQC